MENTMASIGEAKSVYNIFIGVIFGIIMLSIGIYMFFYTSTYNTIKATIVSSDCENNLCKNSVTYNIDGLLFNNNLTSNNKYEIGNVIDINYNIKNKYDINNNSISLKNFGLIFIIISILVIVFVVVNYNLTKNNKSYATYQGINTSFDIANNAVNFGKNLFK